ncbi:MAG: hypothetical protein EAZ85_12075 [Bacteroidetes bacterium]|nr:MAG: hypothetical protein EAZ85_12075 [Bacteroidota bacterium]
MIKMKFLMLFIFFISLNIKNFAQNKTITPEIASEIYDLLLSARKNKNPSIQDLIAMKPSALPPNMNDTLYKYDWGKLRSFHFEDDPNDVIYTWQFANFVVERFIPNNAVEEYEALENSGKRTFTFKQKSLSKNYNVVKKGNYHFIAYQDSDKQTSYSRIVSYKDGILIYDVSVTGTINGFDDTNRIFRRVYVAIPKKF